MGALHKLGLPDLPRHHQTEDHHEVSENAQMSKVPGVVDGTSQHADEEEEEGLQAADPGDLTGRVVR